MTHLSNSVSRGVRLCLGFLVGALGGMSVATAQQAPQGDAASQLEEVVVTGTRIRRAQLSINDSTLPYSVVDSVELEGRQVVNVIDALRDLPYAVVSSNRGSNTQYGDNYAFINLLGLGSARTVTLLNGRRVVASNQGTTFVPGNSPGSQVDLSLINPLMIERVDLVTGSGGAVYGADAIGGVVNIVTKSNFEGASIDASFGTTELNDGDNYRVSGLWGLNFAEGRGNLSISGEFYKGDPIVTGNRSSRRYFGSGISNVYDGAVRNPATFSASTAAATLLSGQSLAAAFLPAGSDGISSAFFGPLSLATTVHSLGGVLHTGSSTLFGQSGGSSGTNFFPAVPLAPSTSFPSFISADPLGAFFAPSALLASQACSATSSACLSVINTLAPGTNLAGLSATQLNSLTLQLLQRNRPTINEYFAANPIINPLLAVALFANSVTGHYARVANTDVATRAVFPFRSVPLQFDSAGNLVPFNIGDLSYNGQAKLGSAFGGDGYDSYAAGHQQVRAATERASVFLQSKFDLTDNVRTRGEYFYTDITYDSVFGSASNSPFGSSTGGSYSVPIYMDQNPYLNSSAKATLNTLVAQGWTPNSIGGSRVFYLGKTLADIYGGTPRSGNEVKTWRVAQSLEGEFDWLDREFYWEIAGGYGKAEARNKSMDVLDVEFALAVDVVLNAAGQPVCRQQTLAAPERITIRNPNLASINIRPFDSRDVALTPSAAQVSACKPLNLFGPGNVSKEARDYVLTDSGSTNENSQTFYSVNFGTDVYELPGGPISVNVQGETRQEEIEFLPGSSAASGLGRLTTVFSNQGELSFDEYGAEIIVPVFGKDFSFPLLRAMELNGAFRTVERSGASPSIYYATDGLPRSDEVFQVGVRWKPFDDVTLRYNVSTAVRSPSLVELFTPPGSGFVAFGGNICVGASSLNGGPNPAVRKKNCIDAVKKLGIATTDAAAEEFLLDPLTIQSVNVSSSRPAGVFGNPNLLNEESDTWSAGLTYQPAGSNLVISADYISIKLKNIAALLNAGTSIPLCFDSEDYPNVVVGGTPACDMFAFGVPNPSNPSQYLIPSVNPITGNPIFAFAPYLAPTGPAVVQYPMATAFYEYRNTNLAAQKLSSTNINIRYRFGVDKLLGEFFENAGKWGEIGLSANVYWINRFDNLANGINVNDNLVGDSFPELQGRFEISHRVGRFAHALQISAINRTVTSNSVAPTYNEYSPTYVTPGYEYYNYYASYLVNNNTTVRFSVANLTDTAGPSLGQYGVSYDGGIGREFTLGVNVRF